MKSKNDKGDMLLGREALAAKEQHQMRGEGPFDFAKRPRAEWSAEIDAGYLGAQGAGDRGRGDDFVCHGPILAEHRRSGKPPRLPAEIVFGTISAVITPATAWRLEGG